MAERVPCNEPGCERTILPETATRTGGRCMPCVQREAAQEQRRYIEANRVDVDRFAGVTDRVELITLAHQRPPLDPLKRYLPSPVSLADMYRDLTVVDLQRLTAVAIQFVESGSKDAREMVSALACLTRADLDEVQASLIRKGDLYAAIAFRHASERVVLDLVELLEQPNASSLLISHTLEALAWTRHPRAIALFSSFREAPPAWSSLLHASTDRYAQVGGWELDVNSKLRSLCGEPCFELVAASQASSSVTRAIVTTQRLCRCGRAMVSLLDAGDARTSLIWLGWPWERLVIPMCSACVCFDTLFFSISEEGDYSELGERTKLPERAVEWPEIQGHGLAVSGQRLPLHAASWLLEVHQSQVGGHPGWIQDTGYPECPACLRTMAFVVQVAHDEFEERAEGTYYGFACAPCRVVAADYQQT